MVNRVIKLEGRGLRGDGFADVARRVGSIAGVSIPPDASDEEILNTLSASVSLTGANVYPDTSSGLAATSDGDSFWVADEVGLRLYRNNLGNADEISPFTSADKISVSGGGDVQSLLDEISPTSPNNSLWEPAPEPAAAEYFATAESGGAGATQLIALWEALRSSAPDRITRVQIGMDQSGTYPLWAYTIAPRRESRRKVLVNCGSHGGEITGMLGVLRAVRQLIRLDATPNERVRFLNDYVTLIVVPVLNPWGLSANPRDRNNVNFVDLNRNFDSVIGPGDVNNKWLQHVNPGTPGFGTKGTAPLSEAETQAIVALVEDNPDLYRAVDVHGFVGVGDGTLDALIYNPSWYYRANREAWRRLLLDYAPAAAPSRISTQDDIESPNMNNSLAMRGVECVTAEYVPLADESLYNAASMRRMVKFHGNVILELACGDRAKAVDPAQTHVRHYVGGARPSGLPTSETDAFVVDTFQTDAPGILIFSGMVTVQSDTSGDTRVFIKPSVGQDAAIPDGFRWSQQAYAMMSVDDIAGASERRTIPFHFAMPIRANLTIRAGLKVWCNQESNNAAIQDMRATAMFIPSPSGEASFKVFQPHSLTDEWTERAPAVLPLLS